MIPHRTLVAASLLTLAACGSGDSDLTSSEDAAAKGEVRGGTVSDGMVPFDQVQSQSPPLQVAPAEGAKPGGDDAGKPDADDDVQEEPAAEDVATPAEAEEPAEEG